MSHAFENYVDDRLDALERQNRRLRRGLIGLTAFVLFQVLATVGWFLLPPPVLKARKIVVVDHNWTPRIELDATEPSMASITLFDGNGKLQVVLAENAGNPALIFLDGLEVNRLELYSTKDEAGLVAKDPTGQKWAELLLSDKADRGLKFVDKDARPPPPKP